MQNYRDIRVWQRAHRLVLRIYALTGTFPATERFGLVQQMRRAAVSVPANIAEGSKRLFKRDYVRFLNIAEASLREVEYYILLTVDLGFSDTSAVRDLAAELDEVSRMLAGFRSAVQKSRENSRLPTPDATPDS
jgi:four helix bundle protein